MQYKYNCSEQDGELRMQYKYNYSEQDGELRKTENSECSISIIIVSKTKNCHHTMLMSIVWP